MTANWSKIALCMVLLSGVSPVQPSFAKEAHAHHARRTAASAPAKNTVTTNAKGTAATGVKVMETKPGGAIDAGVTVLTPRTGRAPGKAPDLNSGLKIAKPQNVQTRRVPMPGLVSPPTRNAIGQPLARPESVTSAAMRSGEPIPRPTTVSNGTIGSVHPAGIGSSSPAMQNPRPLATASLPNRSGIDGAVLVRPAFATSGLGGPAKPVGGINGTTLHRKH